MGYVYLVRNDDLHKIGHTENLTRRIKQLQPCTVIQTLKTDRSLNLEKELHKKYKSVRIPQTEYFRLSDKQVEEVRIALGWVRPQKSKNCTGNHPTPTQGVDFIMGKLTRLEKELYINGTNLEEIQRLRREKRRKTYESQQAKNEIDTTKEMMEINKPARDAKAERNERAAANSSYQSMAFISSSNLSNWLRRRGIRLNRDGVVVGCGITFVLFAWLAIIVRNHS